MSPTPSRGAVTLAVRLLIALAVLALCAGAWFVLRPAEVSGANAGVTLPDAAGAAEPVAATEPTPNAPDSSPLPPADATLPLVLGSLQERANAGDRQAACRLGIELLRCQSLSTYDTFTRPSLVYAESEALTAGNPGLADDWAKANLYYAGIAKACTAIEPALIERGGHYLRQAALAGEPEAMLRYADGQGMVAPYGHDNPYNFGYLRSPDFDAWRREAPEMLARALALGRPEAAHLGRSAHTGDNGRLAGLIRNDPVQAVANQRLIERLQGNEGPPLPDTHELPRLDPAQEAQAEALASQWHARHFGGRRFDAGKTLDGIAPFHVLHSTQGAPRIDLAFCEPTAPPADD